MDENPKLAVILTFAPHNGERKPLQDLCAYSWSLQPGCRVFVAYNGEDGVKELAETCHFELLTGFDTLDFEQQKHKGFNLQSVCKTLLDKIADDEDCKYVGISCGDAPILTEYLVQMLRIYDFLAQGDWMGFAYRHNLPPLIIEGKHPIAALAACKEHYIAWHVNRPGADSFFWSRPTFEKLTSTLPPINMLTWGVERTLWKYGFENIEHNFDLSNNIITVHFTHTTIRPGGTPLDNLPYEETKDPIVTYNRQFTPATLPAIWRGRQIHFLQLKNGMVIQEIVSEPQRIIVPQRQRPEQIFSNVH